jgi:hypothetical protein
MAVRLYARTHSHRLNELFEENSFISELLLYHQLHLNNSEVKSVCVRVHCGSHHANICAAVAHYI